MKPEFEILQDFRSAMSVFMSDIHDAHDILKDQFEVMAKAMLPRIAIPVPAPAPSVRCPVDFTYAARDIASHSFNGRFTVPMSVILNGRILGAASRTHAINWKDVVRETIREAVKVGYDPTKLTAFTVQHERPDSGAWEHDPETGMSFCVQDATRQIKGIVELAQKARLPLEMTWRWRRNFESKTIAEGTPERAGDKAGKTARLIVPG